MTQFPSVPALIPNSRATTANGLPVSRTIRTASATARHGRARALHMRYILGRGLGWGRPDIVIEDKGTVLCVAEVDARSGANLAQGTPPSIRVFATS